MSIKLAGSLYRNLLGNPSDPGDLRFTILLSASWSFLMVIDSSHVFLGSVGNFRLLESFLFWVVLGYRQKNIAGYKRFEIRTLLISTWF